MERIENAKYEIPFDKSFAKGEKNIFDLDRKGEELLEGIVLEKHKGFERIYLKHEVVSIYPIENTTLGRLEGVRIQFFEIDERKTYYKSNGDGVAGFPKNLYIDLDIHNLTKLTSVLLGAVSSYLYNIRSKVLHDTNLYQSIKVRKFNNDKYLKLRLSKHFFREGEKGRYKVSMAFIKKSDIEEIDDTELINFNFTKRDVLILLNLIKRLTGSYLKDAAIPMSVQYIDKDTGEFVAERTAIVGKIFNAIIVDSVWFHGQELLNMMYATHELIYKLYIEKSLEEAQCNYRQIKFYPREDIMYLDIIKMNSKHEEVYQEYNGKKVIIRIPIGSLFLAAMFMYLDVDILRHTSFDAEYYEETGENKLAQLLSDNNIKYHISLKESYLGIGTKPDSKDPENTKLYFAGIAKEGKFKAELNDGDVLENYILKYDEHNIAHAIPVIGNFHIDLRDKWTIFIKALSYGFTREYLEEDREFDMNKFYVINQDITGYYKYEFTIYSNTENKAPVVLIIDKYKLSRGEDPKLIGRFRQPLFRKYIYQLLSVFLAAGKEMTNIKLTEEIKANELLPYKHKSYKTVEINKKNDEVKYGIKKINDKVYWGNFKTKTQYVELPRQDIDLLNMSSEFRIFNAKRWIPFTGEKITLTQNGYITDMFSEYHLEKDNKGVIWATRLYYGTNTKY